MRDLCMLVPAEYRVDSLAELVVVAFIDAASVYPKPRHAIRSFLLPGLIHLVITFSFLYRFRRCLSRRRHHWGPSLDIWLSTLPIQATVQRSLELDVQLRTISP
jgi:hypothetical protein